MIRVSVSTLSLLTQLGDPIATMAKEAWLAQNLQSLHESNSLPYRAYFSSINGGTFGVCQVKNSKG